MPDQADDRKAALNLSSLRQALYLLGYLHPYRWQFFLALLCILLSAFSTSLFPFLLGKMIDATVPGASAALPVAAASGSLGHWIRTANWSLNTILLLVFAQLTMQTLFSYGRIYLLTEVGEKVVATLRSDVYARLLRMPMAFFAERRVGELTSRLAADLSLIQDTVSFTLAELLRGLFTLLIGLIFIFIISTKLALVMLSVVPLVAVLAVVFGLRIRRMARRVQDQLADSNTIVQETLSGIAAVKSFTGEQRAVQRYRKSIFSAASTAISNARFRGAFVSFMIFSVFGTIALVIWYGARLIHQGELSVGLLIMFVIFSVFVGGTFAGFAEMFSQVQKMLGATHNVRELLFSEGEVAHFDDEQVEAEWRLNGAVSFQDVGFAYPSRRELPVLRNVSLHIRPGEQVALVGPSGAGKTTIASLMLRFYEPDSGTILFDGRDARSFPLRQLRRQIALVPQDVMLFGGSIYENIALGNPQATEQQVKEAARLAHALEFIERFPQGFQTVVGERGVKLSGGQRQRIAIARALLKDPVILILDEATSSLDSESEHLVQEALELLMKNRTSLIIAHRLSTVRHADRIVVLDKGVVVETGSHDELIALPNGFYRRLVELQVEEVG
ncbi:MAG: ABC transporter transmembrane domain-containing protein [Chitinophagales bacterium]|nr:ABC transporter transmembrane domain-containing protein [Chitinophagales bacterium]